MAMFDPVYVTEVLNDILSRRGLKISMVPKGKEQAAACPEFPQADVSGQAKYIDRKEVENGSNFRR